jgi:hypothetical protein
MLNEKSPELVIRKRNFENLVSIDIAEDPSNWAQRRIYAATITPFIENPWLSDYC